MKILVVDTETTGLEGCPRDLVLEVAAVEADTSEGAVRPVYSQVVGYDVDAWSPGLGDSWVFRHSDLTLAEVSGGKPLREAAEEARALLDGRECTSYNVAFDFGRFLSRPPWGVRPRLCPDVMLRASRLVEGDHMFGGGSASWPKLSKAYAALCPGDPGGIGRRQRHRALEDAAMAAHVLLALDSMGEYMPQ